MKVYLPTILLMATLAVGLLVLGQPAAAQTKALPEGPGLAQGYPGDVGIEAHPAVVFVEGFEVDSIAELNAKWSTVSSEKTLSISNDAPPGSPGGRSLQVEAHRGETRGGYVYKVLEEGYDKLHMRFYVKFADDSPYSHHFVRMQGRIDPPPYPLGGAGTRPENHFSVGLDAVKSSGNTYPAVDYPPPGVWGFYNYWPEMRSWQTVTGQPDPRNPSFYGNAFWPNPAVPIPRDEWIAVEFMTKLNSTPEESDGEIALWINGKLVGHWGPGTVDGYWVRDQFRTDPNTLQSAPFEGFRWRHDPEVKINIVKLENYLEDRAFQWAEEWLKNHPDTHVNLETATIWFDHFVVATEYIGPLAEQPGEQATGGGINVAECDNPQEAWIWCDDFEVDRLSSYFEYTQKDTFQRVEGVGVSGSTAMRQKWSPGQVSGGTLKLAFGKTAEPYVRPVDDGEERYREIYWRLYLKHEEDWEGGGAAKLSRATILMENWKQAMIAHVWSSGGSPPNDVYLAIDLASGTDIFGNVRTTRYNDFDNLRWLGNPRSSLPLFDADHVGQWYCIESYVRLNDPGLANGVQRLWINGKLEAERINVNWVGSFDEYGINALFIENYWNDGSPKAQERYIDNIVVSTEPIGCL